MIILVGYVPKPEGRAALERAVEEATLRGGRLVVINASRGDSYVDSGFAPVQEIELVKSRLAESGVDYEFRQLVRGNEPSEEIVEGRRGLGRALRSGWLASDLVLCEERFRRCRPAAAVPCVVAELADNPRSS